MLIDLKDAIGTLVLVATGVGWVLVAGGIGVAIYSLIPRRKGGPSPLADLAAIPRLAQEAAERADAAEVEESPLALPGADATPCVTCGRPSVAVCVSCGRGACEGDTMHHLYSLFLTKRYGTDADQVGSKFFYLCESTSLPVCVDCLGVRDAYPCPPEEVESHAFACPHCRGRASVFRVDRAHGWDAAAEMLRTAAALGAHARPEGVDYDRHDRFREVPPGKLVATAFGPRARPLRPGEAWETAVRLVRATGETALLVLQRRDHPAPGTALYLEGAEAWTRLHAPSGGEVWGSEALAPLLGAGFAERIATFSLGPDGAYVTNEAGPWSVFVEKRGIRPARPDDGSPPAGGVPFQEETPDDSAFDEEDFAALDARRAHREDIEATLERVTEMAVWDYQWLEAPRPGDFGPHAALAIAGSTNLTYYHLLHLRFLGVRYSTCPRYFSHAAFFLASPPEERQLRALADFGAQSVAVRIETDFGGSFGMTAYVVCDGVELFLPAEGDPSLKEPYRPVIAENCDWWWPEELRG